MTHPTPPATPTRESIRFRSAEDGDTEALVSLWEACGLTRAWNDPRKDIEFARAGATSDVLVGTFNDEIMASVMVGHDGHRGAVYYVSVSPARRGLRLGREVMAAAEDWLRGRGVWKLNLLVRKTNAGVIGFYEELGYKDSDTMSLQKVL
ncbi:MAG: GNAT family acetyltransferase [Parvibaculum sp.]|nr:GNAT family acetyltransferase [Parvibaculum sp.]